MDELTLADLTLLLDESEAHRDADPTDPDALMMAELMTELWADAVVLEPAPDLYDTEA
jgi:hypothetical protein